MFLVGIWLLLLVFAYVLLVGLGFGFPCVRWCGVHKVLVISWVYVDWWCVWRLLVCGCCNEFFCAYLLLVVWVDLLVAIASVWLCGGWWFSWVLCCGLLQYAFPWVSVGFWGGWVGGGCWVVCVVLGLAV